MAIDLEKLRKEAEGGSTVAQTIVGSYLLDGIKVPADYPKAFELLTKAAEAGAPRAMFHLARMYAEGHAVERDLAKAQALFEAASDKGEFLAHIYLARIFLLTDQTTAAYYYQRAADLQDVMMESDEMNEAVEFLESELNPTRSKPH
ncbi:MAG: tetratricopeptide repeat protein [Gammaproteobacteria bacterium]